jgi:hypothetical protein
MYSKVYSKIDMSFTKTSGIDTEDKNLIIFDKVVLPNHIESRNEKQTIINKQIYKQQPEFYRVPNRNMQESCPQPQPQPQPESIVGSYHENNYNRYIAEQKNEKDVRQEAIKDMYYAFDDPRLIDAPRNIMTFLDAKPFGQRGIVGLTHDEVYSYDNDAGTEYKNYSDIKFGNIVYRTKIGKGSEPYNNPNYVIRAGITHSLFKDPMDNIQRQYTRVPFSRDRVCDDTRLEFTRDTLAHREDIMMNQFNKMNSRDWNFRFKQPMKSVI